MSSPQDSVPDPNKDTVRQPADEAVPLANTTSSDLLSQDASVALDLGSAQAIAGDRYRLERLAGSGGMGFVFVAHDERLDRKVAIKFLKDVETSSLRDRLLKEARAMAGLRHPGICLVYEVNIDATRPFIVMGWIDGLELDRAWWNMEVEQRLELFEGIVDATTALHDAGLVHLDIKPTNILVDRTGNPVIVDFGLARASTRGSTGSSGGTPGYAAPEQFGTDHHTSPACDVYALGMVLYFGLTDQLPWSESDPLAIIERARSEEAPPPGEFNPDIPWPLQRITLVAIERDPTLRYQDAKSLLRDLQRYRRGDTVSARPSTLLNTFHTQVQQRQDESETWHDRGLITRQEADQLQRVYDRLQQPDSHWIVDSRRLSVSQVTLYTGGWLLMIALTIGMGFTWDAFRDVAWLRYSIPVFITSVLLTIGILLANSQRKRLALGYMFTACILIPVTLGIFLIEVEWLTFDEQGQFLRMLDLPQVVTNFQLLACSICLLVSATIANRVVPSNAFSPMVVIGIILAGMSGWASVGLLQNSGASLALFGLWLLAMGIVLLAVGLPASVREQRQLELIVPGSDARTRVAWSVLSGGVLLVIIGLTLIAWNRPWLYLPGLLPAPDAESLGSSFPRVDDRARAVAFMINGLLLLGLSFLLSRYKTNACRRLAELVRWLIPAHVIGGLLALEHETWRHTSNSGVPVASWIWLGIAGLCSLAFGIASVLRQWRPFLISGLIGIAVVYWTLFARLDELLEQSTFEPTAIALVVIACLAGIFTMVIAGRIKSLQAPDG